MQVNPINPIIFIFGAIIVFWQIILTWFLFKKNKLSSSSKSDDLRTLFQRLEVNKQEQAIIKRELSEHKLASLSHFHRLGFLRYNPFSDTGGDQSFCLCLLDGQGSGVVISSLHSRDQTRIYAKRIEKGASRGYTLSKEERAVIQEAIKA